MSTEFDESLLQVYRNFCFSGFNAFTSDVLPDERYSEHLGDIFLYGCLYRQICFMLKCELSLEEFEAYCSTCLDRRYEHGHAIYSFIDTDLVRVETRVEGERSVFHIFPLLHDCIVQDMLSEDHSVDEN